MADLLPNTAVEERLEDNQERIFQDIVPGGNQHVQPVNDSFSRTDSIRSHHFTSPNYAGFEQTLLSKFAETNSPGEPASASRSSLKSRRHALIGDPAEGFKPTGNDLNHPCTNVVSCQQQFAAKQ